MLVPAGFWLNIDVAYYCGTKDAGAALLVEGNVFGFYNYVLGLNMAAVP